MSDGPRYPIGYARTIAEALIHDLKDLCSRIEIAGSIRRGKTEVGDAEVICIPTSVPCIQEDLFAAKEKVDSELIKLRLKQLEWLRPREPVRMGERYMALENYPKWLKENVPKYERPTDLPIDLFVVLPPAQWGVIMTIRTGPADYSKTLMERAIAMGMRVKDGALHDQKGRVIDTPEEKDFYYKLGLPYAEPDRRQ